jgi:hypothetical protein
MGNQGHFMEVLVFNHFFAFEVTFFIAVIGKA